MRFATGEWAEVNEALDNLLAADPMTKDEAQVAIALGTLKEGHRCPASPRCEVCVEDNRCPDCREFFDAEGSVWYTIICQRCTAIIENLTLDACLRQSQGNA